MCDELDNGRFKKQNLRSSIKINMPVCGKRLELLILSRKKKNKQEPLKGSREL